METHHPLDDITSVEAITELRRVKEKLRALQKIAGIGIWELRISDQHLMWSDEACRAAGIASHGFNGPLETFVSSFVRPDDRQRLLAAVEQATQQKTPLDMEHRLVRPDGQLCHVHMRAQLLSDESGQLLFGTVQDITGKKQSEKDPLPLAPQLTATLESITDAFYTLDRQWRFTYVNKEAEQLLRRPRAEVLGKVIWEEFSDTVGSAFDHAYHQAMTESRQVSFEQFYAPLDVWVEIHAYPTEEGLAVYFSDVSERKRAESALRESEERFKVVAKVTSDAIWDWQVTTDRVWWSEGIRSLFGFSHQEIDNGIAWWTSRIHPEDRDRVWRSIEAAIDGPGESWSSEYRFLRTDRSYADVLDRALFIRRSNGKAVRMIGSMIDITERKRAERERQEAEARIRAQASLLDKAQDAIIVCAVDGRISFWNKSAERLYGWTTEEALGQTKLELIVDDRESFDQAMHMVLERGEWSSEIRKRRKDGSTLMVETHWTLVRDDNGQPQSLLAIETDITRRKEAEREIERLAFFDPLTRLPNRRLLLDRLQHALAASRRSGHAGALLFIDLDNFKILNDTLGHDKGDMLLQQVARRLETCVPRKSDTVARLGGDEFVVMLEDLNSNPQDAAVQAEIVGEKILAVFNQPFQLDGYEHHTTPSIGVTLFDHRLHNIDELLKRADLAMYQAKASGRNAVRFFDPEMQTVVTARVSLETDLRHGLQQHEFFLQYQAQADANGRKIGAEALVRWQHPRRGLVSPALFIPLAEETGLILRLGQWVLETACRQLALWAEKSDMSHLSIAVNVSARQFRSPNFVEQVLDVLNYTGADPHNLKLELTESLLVQNVENIITKMTALKEKGVSFALDDFGTGYSSLFYLKRLPLDQLKIDQSFVKDVLTDANDAAIARTIVVLGQTLGLQVIAEGVETADQRDFLAQQGCHAYQGYLFGPPLPAEQF